MEEPVWLDRMILEAIHAEQIREHGGSFGLRDEGLLESALARPRQKWSYGSDPDLASLAAAYGFGLCKNHPFVDGNKRASLMAIFVFLDLNGFDLDAPEPEAVEMITSVASGTTGEEDLAHWVRSRIRPLRQTDDHPTQEADEADGGA